MVVNVPWKWLIWSILQRNWAKTSNPVSTMGPGVNLTFFGPIGSHFMWKDCLHEKIPSTSNFFLSIKLPFISISQDAAFLTKYTVRSDLAYMRGKVVTWHVDNQNTRLAFINQGSARDKWLCRRVVNLILLLHEYRIKMVPVYVSVSKCFKVFQSVSKCPKVSQSV